MGSWQKHEEKDHLRILGVEPGILDAYQARTTSEARIAVLKSWEEKSSERWKTLPPVTSVNLLRGLKPGAVVLLNGVVPDGQRAEGPGGHVRHYEQPVLAYQRFGKGLAIALPVQDTYQWKMDATIPVDDPTFVTFWRQLLRWITSDVPNRVTVTSQSDVASVCRAVA